MGSVTKIKRDDYASWHADYQDDTDLVIVADELDATHEAGSLVWLYWPRIIGAAKKAKTFGWFRTTPKLFAQSIHDPINGAAWVAREAMWNALVDSGRLFVRQGRVEAPSQRIDVLVVNWEDWQSTTYLERKRLEREREKIQAGESVHWTMAQRDEFRHTGVTRLRAARDNAHEKSTFCDMTPPKLQHVTKNEGDVTKTGGNVTALDKTRQDQRKEGNAGEPENRADALPPILIDAIECAAVTGIAPQWWKTGIEKHRRRNPDVPDDVWAQTIDDIVQQADGRMLVTARAASMLDGFAKSAVSKHRGKAASGQPANQPAPRLLSAVIDAEQARIEAECS